MPLPDLSVYYYLFDGEINPNIAGNRLIIDEFYNLEIQTELIKDDIIWIAYNEHAIVWYVYENYLIVSNSGMGCENQYSTNELVAPLVFSIKDFNCINEMYDIMEIVNNHVNMRNGVYCRKNISEVTESCKNEPPEIKKLCEIAVDYPSDNIVLLMYALLFNSKTLVQTSSTHIKTKNKCNITSLMNTEIELTKLYEQICKNQKRVPDVKLIENQYTQTVNSGLKIISDSKTIPGLDYKLTKFKFKFAENVGIMINQQQSGSCSFYSMYILHLTIMYITHEPASFISAYIDTYNKFYREYKKHDHLVIDSGIFSKAFTDNLAEKHMGIPSPTIESHRSVPRLNYIQVNESNMSIMEFYFNTRELYTLLKYETDFIRTNKSFSRPLQLIMDDLLKLNNDIQNTEEYNETECEIYMLYLIFLERSYRDLLLAECKISEFNRSYFKLFHIKKGMDYKTLESADKSNEFIRNKGLDLIELLFLDAELSYISTYYLRNKLDDVSHKWKPEHYVKYIFNKFEFSEMCKFKHLDLISSLECTNYTPFYLLNKVNPTCSQTYSSINAAKIMADYSAAILTNNVDKINELKSFVVSQFKENDISTFTQYCHCVYLNILLDDHILIYLDFRIVKSIEMGKYNNLYIGKKTIIDITSSRIFNSPSLLINFIKSIDDFTDTKSLINKIISDNNSELFDHGFTFDNGFMYENVRYTICDSIFGETKFLLERYGIFEYNVAMLSSDRQCLRVITEYGYMVTFIQFRHAFITINGLHFKLLELKCGIRNIIPKMCPYLYYVSDGVGYIKIPINNSWYNENSLAPTCSSRIDTVLDIVIAPSELFPVVSSFDIEKYKLLLDTYYGHSVIDIFSKFNMLESVVLDVIDIKLLESCINIATKKINFSGTKIGNMIEDVDKSSLEMFENSISMCTGINNMELKIEPISYLPAPINNLIYDSIYRMITTIISTHASDINNAQNCWSVQESLKILKNIKQFIIPSLKNGTFKMYEMLFILQNKYFIYEHQYLKYKEILGEALAKNKKLKVHQFMMGKGKTSVITPLLAISLKYNKLTPNIITLKHLVKQTKSYISLTEYICNINVNVFDENESKLRWLESTDGTLASGSNIAEEYNIIDEFDSMYDYNHSTFNYIKDKGNCLEYTYHRSIFEYVMFREKLDKEKEYLINRKELDCNYDTASRLVYNSKYGFDYESNNLLFIPYLRKDTPIKNSNFSSLLLTLILTFKYFINNRFNDTKLLYNCFKNMFPIKDPELDEFCDIYESDMDFNKKLIKLSEINKITNFHQVLEQFLFNTNKTKLNITKSQYNMSFQDIIYNNYNQWQVGYSGTVNLGLVNYEDTDSYVFREIIPDFDEQIEIKLALAGFGSNKPIDILVIRSDNTIRFYLLTIIQDLQLTRGVIDLCGLFIEYDNRYIAGLIDEYFKGTKKVIYFDKQNNVLEYGIVDKKYRGVDNDNFYYYDQCHIVGTDVEQPKTGKFAIIINDKSKLTEFSQAIFRFRKLNRGTFMSICMLDKKYTSKEIYDMLNFNEKNYARSQLFGIEFQYLKAVTRKNNVPRSYLEHELIPSFLFDARQNSILSVLSDSISNLFGKSYNYSEYLRWSIVQNTPNIDKYKLYKILEPNFDRLLNEYSTHISVEQNINTEINTKISMNKYANLDSKYERCKAVLYHVNCDECINISHVKITKNLYIAHNITLQTETLFVLKINDDLFINDIAVIPHYYNNSPAYTINGLLINYGFNYPKKIIFPDDVRTILGTIRCPINLVPIVKTLDDTQKLLLFRVISRHNIPDELVHIIETFKYTGTILKLTGEHESKSKSFPLLSNMERMSNVDDLTTKNIYNFKYKGSEYLNPNAPFIVRQILKSSCGSNTPLSGGTKNNSSNFYLVLILIIVLLIIFLFVPLINKKTNSISQVSHG